MNNVHQLSRVKVAVEIEVLEIDGIDHNDYPDYCDAYVAAANLHLPNGDIVEANDRELDEINDDGDFVYHAVMEAMY